MTKANNIKPLKRVFQWTVAVNILFILIFSLFFFFSSKFFFHTNLVKRFEYYQKLFVSSIFDNVMTGQDNEVYRKCLEFFEDPDVVSVIVTRVNPNHFICNMSKDKKNEKIELINTPILYNQNTHDKACDVIVAYSLKPIKIILNKIFFFIFVIAAVLLLTQLISIKKLQNAVTLPIHKISQYFSKILPENVQKIDFINSKFYEILLLEKGINTIIEKLKDYEIKTVSLAKDAVMAKVAAQLSHDIRSPLAALKVVRDMGSSALDPDQTKLLTMSIDRITDIANTILPKNIALVENKENVQSCFLWMLVDQIVSEKRVEYKNSNDISIDFKSESSPFELNAQCNPTEFMRSISNMINNCVEAKDPMRKLSVLVELKSSGGSVTLTISDNGNGISPDILSRVFDEGFSHGKSSGTGLGLYQVKKAIESWNGSVDIKSQENTGTVITIQLKQSAQPQWLISSINISQYQNIFVLDDEEYVFSILQDRFEKHFKDIRYFKRIDEFEQHVQTFSKSLLFIDHDLKQNLNGIDLIQKHQLQSQSILLTGNYDDKQVQQRAIELGIKILPKPLINDLPITV